MSQRRLRGAQIKGSEFARAIYYSRPDAGTTADDLMRPDFWANVAAQLRPGDRIEVYPEDGAFFAELLVRSSSRLAAVVIPLRAIDLSGSSEETIEEPGFSVKFRGPRKFCVIRNSDGVPVIEDIDTKEQAFRELEDYLKAHAA